MTLAVPTASVESSIAHLRAGPGGADFKMNGMCVWGMPDRVADAVAADQYTNRAAIVAKMAADGCNVVRFRILADDYNAQSDLTHAAYIQRIVDWYTLFNTANIIFMPCDWNPLDGNNKNSAWVGHGSDSFALFAAIHAALGSNPANFIWEMWNEPNNISWSQWQTEMKAGINELRSTIGYRGLIVCDPIDWANSNGGGYSDSDYSAIETYDTGLLGSPHQIAFACHQYVTGMNPWSAATFQSRIGGASQIHLIFPTETGNYNNGSEDLSWSSAAAAGIFAKQSLANIIGQVFFLYRWVDDNTIYASDDKTPTLWGNIALSNLPLPATPGGGGMADETTWAPSGRTTPFRSDAAAAALVTHVSEMVPGNVTANNYIPNSTELAAYLAANPGGVTAASFTGGLANYVTGQAGLYLVNPSTDDLIQWASHKWGIPTDWLRAQYWHESQWGQSGGVGHGLGDETNVGSANYTAYPAQARLGDGVNVYESMGICQVRWNPAGSYGIGSEPLRWKATAFNIDYQCMILRMYFDDPNGARSSWGDGTYVAGQQWNSIGGWYNPYPWNNSGQLGYESTVQGILAARSWPQGVVSPSGVALASSAAHVATTATAELSGGSTGAMVGTDNLKVTTTVTATSLTGGNVATIIPGATGPTYTPQASDAGHTLQVRVIATNEAGDSDPVMSNVVGPISSIGIPPVNTTPPSILTPNGLAVGAVVNGNDGVWVNAPTSYTRQWNRSGSVTPSVTTNAVTGMFSTTQSSTTLNLPTAPSTAANHKLVTGFKVNGATCTGITGGGVWQKRAACLPPAGAGSGDVEWWDCIAPDGTQAVTYHFSAIPVQGASADGGGGGVLAEAILGDFDKATPLNGVGQTAFASAAITPSGAGEAYFGIIGTQRYGASGAGGIFSELNPSSPLNADAMDPYADCVWGTTTSLNPQSIAGAQGAGSGEDWWSVIASYKPIVAGQTPISGATGATYTLVTGDIADQITYTVTAINAAAPSGVAAQSNPVGPVVASGGGGGGTVVPNAPISYGALVFQSEWPDATWDTKWSHYRGPVGQSPWSMNGVVTSSANAELVSETLGGETHYNMRLKLSDTNTGAMITTNPGEGGGGFQTHDGYYIEARLYFPASGDGSNGTIYNWGAWWIVVDTGAPSYDEVDMSEILGGNMTVNDHGPGGGNMGSVAGNWGNTWFTSGVLRATSMRYQYYNNQLVKSWASGNNNSQPMGIDLNIGMGGPLMLGAAGALRIDYVRVWANCTKN